MMRIDGPDMKKILKQLPNEKLARVAAKSAINDALRSGKVAAGEEVARDYNTGPRSAFKGAKTEKATNNKIHGFVNFNTPPNELKKWGTNPGTRRKKKNPKVWGKVQRSRSTQYAQTFLGKSSGKTRAYIRTSSKRFPIRPVYGPAPSQLVGAKNVKARFIKRANEVLEKRLMHHIKFLSSKL